MSRLRLALVAGCAIALSACSLTTEVATQKEYAPSEGIRIELGDRIDFENVFLLTNGSEGDAYLYGMVDNNSDSDETVTITASGENAIDESFDVPARTVHNFGSTEAQEAGDIVKISGNFAPGTTVPIEVTGGGETAEAYLPVLTACTADYEEIFPDALQCPEREEPADDHGHDH